MAALPTVDALSPHQVETISHWVEVEKAMETGGRPIRVSPEAGVMALANGLVRRFGFGDQLIDVPAA